MAQPVDPTPTPPAQSAGPVDVHVDLSGLAALIWQTFIDHIGDIGTVAWQGIKEHIGEIGLAIWTPLVDQLRKAAADVWDGIWHSSLNIVTQVPLDLTLNFGPYRAIATDPLPVAV